jgi:hypothetical protein
VWLGFDHGFGGAPLIFETMIFGYDGDDQQWRYSTEREALKGHDRAVALCKDALGRVKQELENE